MNLWTAIVIIVAIGALASVLRSRYNAQHGITEDMMGNQTITCLLYTSPSPRDGLLSRMPSSA